MRRVKRADCLEIVSGNLSSRGCPPAISRFSDSSRHTQVQVIVKFEIVCVFRQFRSN